MDTKVVNMKAIILAAGEGKRLRPLTYHMPKCMVEIQGKPLIEHNLDNLVKCGINEIIIVCGYKAETIINRFGTNHNGVRIKYILNMDYENNDNMFSMGLARNEITEDIIYFNADVICNPNIIRKMINSPHKNVIVIDDVNPIEQDHMKVRIVDGKLEEIRRDLEDPTARAIGMYKLCLEDAKKYYANIDRLIFDGKTKLKIEIPMTMMFPNFEIHAESTENHAWFEVDDARDLASAHQIGHLFIENNISYWGV